MKIETTTTKAKQTFEPSCPISSKVVELLIKQIAHELYNHNLYMSFSNYFGVAGLSVLEEYYKRRADEEYLHHRWIKDFLNENDIKFKYPTVDSIKETWDDFVTPFELTVAKEEETTDLIYDIVECAMDEKDWFTYAWLQGKDMEKGALILEQIEEESISRTALDIARMEGSWLRKEKSIMNAYTKDVD